MSTKLMSNFADLARHLAARHMHWRIAGDRVLNGSDVLSWGSLPGTASPVHDLNASYTGSNTRHVSSACS